jgi:hypothetical protein
VSETNHLIPGGLPSPEETANEGDSIDWESGRLSYFESLDAVDCIDEDFNRNEQTRVTGFVGKSSELTWLRRLRIALDQLNTGQQDPRQPFHQDTHPEQRPTRMPPSETHDNLSIMSLSYHLDDISVSAREIVDSYMVPPQETANMMLEVYLTSVHPSFPILSIMTFMPQYRTFYERPEVKPGDKWLAILNMVFAIAAKYSYMTQADRKDGESDHLMFFTRARALSMNGETLFDHPDLQQVQVEGLVTFYFLLTEQINRYAIL